MKRDEITIEFSNFSESVLCLYKISSTKLPQSTVSGERTLAHRKKVEFNSN